MARKQAPKASQPTVKRRQPRRPRIYERVDWPQLEKAILDNVSGGYYVEDAFRAVGLSERTWYKHQAIADQALESAYTKAEAAGHDDYMRFVKRKDRIMVHFVQAVRQKQAARIIANAAAIAIADPLEYNSRVQHEKWGRKDRMTLVGDPENPLNTGVVVILPDNGRGPPKTGEAPPTEVKPEDKK
jgi:hypothetical protein